MPLNVSENEYRVLLVDDDRYVLLILGRILQGIGCYVSVVEKGCDALQHLESQNFDAVIIDVRLQDMNGIDLLNLIHKKTPTMTKIVFRGYPSDEDRLRALEQGANYYLAKPIPSEKLIQIIENNMRA